jgi:hypothetical protein
MQKNTEEQTITCPNCGKQIPLTDVLTKQIEDKIRADFDAQLKSKDAELRTALKAKDDEWKKLLEQDRIQIQQAARKKAEESLGVELRDLKSQLAEKSELLKRAEEQELQLRKKQRELEDREQRLNLEVDKRLEEQKKKIYETAKESAAVEIRDLKEQLTEKSRELDEARKIELEARKRLREVEDKERNLTLEIERKVAQEREQIASQARTTVEEEFKLKTREKDIVIEGLKKQIDELKRKAEQGSNQLQGEAQEVELYELLSAHFKYDSVSRVRKGKEGADDLMEVHNQNGVVCGSILFESKRTKTWSDNWIEKAKNDQREAKADLVVIVSRVLPRDIPHIGQHEGVWICDLQSAIGLATALREALLAVSHARAALAGKNEKMELIYQYLSGPEFKRRIEAIIEAFRYMKEDLEAEKRATYKRWAEREKQIEKVTSNAAGLYGDIQGIVAGILPEIKALELPAAQQEEEIKTDDLPF